MMLLTALGDFPWDGLDRLGDDYIHNVKLSASLSYRKQLKSRSSFTGTSQAFGNNVPLQWKYLSRNHRR